MINPRAKLTEIIAILDIQVLQLKKEQESGLLTSDHIADLGKISKMYIDIAQDKDVIIKAQIDEINRRSQEEVIEDAKKKFNLIEADRETVKKHFGLVDPNETIKK